MSTLTKGDYVQLMIDESADLADLLATLEPADWDADTLCQGWKVRHVISHMVVGHTMPTGRYLLALATSGGIAKNSNRLALAYGDTHTPAQILSAFRAGTSVPPKGPATFVAPPELFLDHLIHHQDIRRPLGLPREIPTARLAHAFDLVPRLGGILKPNRVVRGLTLVAADLDRRAGTGPEVYGSAEALIMCAGGRGAALADLKGPGVPALAARLGRA
jgi:uncharacterized protein (TIGR03083 family)